VLRLNELPNGKVFGKGRRDGLWSGTSAADVYRPTP
jgi:hypothetical protein